MKTLIALLRAVNVTGTGTLKMEDLRGHCTQAGFRQVRSHQPAGQR
jgi:uncharacterized protein (DUF1697 family)